MMGNFSYFSKTICCDSSSEPSQRDGSDEGHNICFYAELTKIVPNYHQILLLCSAPFSSWTCPVSFSTMKIKKIGTPKIIPIIILKLKQFDFEMQ